MKFKYACKRTDKKCRYSAQSNHLGSLIRKIKDHDEKAHHVHY